ncbi:DUF922 domain-containing protein [Pseudodesulfovibrio cashew]|uniref:DUF922 domain-containing protein n=1 Tax=Pseudodesulfovibrio cashew TaxID=2678688 RepID=A0A6I6JDK1_9BACT|nr:DUF922 domain-containing protein [Pseudodesulfovibrio cashew]QGY40906.1 DUF922 domain-containing protein [Pseudodesulfovibrio cashew]
MKRISILLLLILFATPAFAEVVEEEIKDYYSIAGVTRTEILRNLQRRAPYKQAGSFVPAFTQTDLKYQIRLKQQGGRCGVDKVTVFLNLTYKYPRLAQHQSTNTRLWWRDIIKHYTIHEEIHGAISRKWAKELDRTLLSLTDLNCETAWQTIKARASYINRQLQKEQQEYDRITEHGQKQYRYKGHL